MEDLPPLEEVQKTENFCEFSEAERKKMVMEYMNRNEGEGEKIELEVGESRELLGGYFKVRKTEEGIELILYSDS